MSLTTTIWTISIYFCCDDNSNFIWYI